MKYIPFTLPVAIAFGLVNAKELVDYPVSVCILVGYITFCIYQLYKMRKTDEI